MLSCKILEFVWVELNQIEFGMGWVYLDCRELSGTDLSCIEMNSTKLARLRKIHPAPYGEGPYILESSLYPQDIAHFLVQNTH